MFTLLPRILVMLPSLAMSAVALPAGAATPKDARPVTVEGWASDFSDRVSDAIEWPSSEMGDGTAIIQRTDNARVEILHLRSSDRRVEAAVRLALSRIRNVPPLSPDVDPHHPVRINILLGGITDRVYQKRREAMIATAAEANRQWPTRTLATSDNDRVTKSTSTLNE